MATSGGPRPNRHQFECEPELWAWIEDYASKTGLTKTGVIQAALEIARASSSATASIGIRNEVDIRAERDRLLGRLAVCGGAQAAGLSARIDALTWALGEPLHIGLPPAQRGA